MTFKIPEFFINLNPLLKNYIQNELKWRHFNKIQEEAIPLIMKGNDTLLISPTASGKTEAVLIPVFNDILNNDLEPTSVLYISPLKALINDMNNRIEDWSEHFSLTTTRWHGDVSNFQKQKFINKPTDFLSITPESLEVILMNKTFNEKKRIFKNIKYVIIDEIHNLIDSERGLQLNSLLNRIQVYCDNDFIKLGLSATVGNPYDIAKWLNSINPAQIVKIDQDPEFYYDIQNGSDINIANRLRIYKNKKKILIFVKRRNDVEKYNNILKRLLNYNNILVHHSSVDGQERESNELQFKNLPNGFMISTTTLELGIDIGNIFAVAQIGVPNTVSSFMQKIGRSGRGEKNKSKTIVFYNDDSEIFLVLAEILLGKEGIIEKIPMVKKPFDIYFHQILSILFTQGKLDRNELFYFLNKSYSFKNISLIEFNYLIDYLTNINIIDNYDNILSTGYQFEKEFGKKNFLDFYAVFCPKREYAVKNGRKKIGSLGLMFALKLQKDTNFILAGQLWKVLSIDHPKYIVHVINANVIEGNIPIWEGDKPPLSYLLSRKIYSLLLGKFDYKLLNFNKSHFDNNSIEIIENYIKEVKASGFKEGVIPIEFDANTNLIYIYSFAGDKANMLLYYIFNYYYKTSTKSISPYYCSFKVKDGCSFEDVENVLYNVKELLSNEDSKIEISKLFGKFYNNKFIKYLPDNMRFKLQYELIFDEKGLIDLCENNTPILINSSCIKNWNKFKKEEKKEDNGKK